MLSLTVPSLLEALRRRVAENPARPNFSLLDASGVEAETLTWGELDHLARAVAAALRDRFEVEVLLRTLFEKPTVAEMARAVTQSRFEQAHADEIERLLTDLRESLSEKEAAGLLAAGKGSAQPKETP